MYYVTPSAIAESSMSHILGYYFLAKVSNTPKKAFLLDRINKHVLNSFNMLI